MSCIICETLTNKYKCPKCLEPYCSLNCFKEHKNQTCENKKASAIECTESNIEEPTIHEPFSTEDTVPNEKLELLRKCEPLQHLLYNHHLRNLLKEIDSAPNAWKAMNAAMQEPLFLEFADECLKLIESESDNK